MLASPAVKIANQHVFNVKIPFEGGPITNQRQSGRCWLFASTNIFRIALMQKYNLDSFELSQAYLFYWDKLEKSNWFLEQIISTADMDLDSRLVQTLLQEPLSDGGQVRMFPFRKIALTSRESAILPILSYISPALTDNPLPFFSHP